MSDAKQSLRSLAFDYFRQCGNIFYRERNGAVHTFRQSLLNLGQYIETYSIAVFQFSLFFRWGCSKEG